jgi:hypothetical protein
MGFTAIPPLAGLATRPPRLNARRASTALISPSAAQREAPEASPAGSLNGASRTRIYHARPRKPAARSSSRSYERILPRQPPSIAWRASTTSPGTPIPGPKRPIPTASIVAARSLRAAGKPLRPPARRRVPTSALRSASGSAFHSSPADRRQTSQTPHSQRWGFLMAGFADSPLPERPSPSTASIPMRWAARLRQS